MKQAYLEASQENGKALFMRQIEGEIIMLNLLKFRDQADYSDYPELAPKEPISGKEAYTLYSKHTFPLLKEAGGDIMFTGEGGQYLIGPSDTSWDLVMLVKHKSLEAFMSFAKNETYLKGMGHRQAALEDSRLLPISQNATEI